MRHSALVVLVLLAGSSLAQANDVHKRTELGIAQVELSERLKSRLANTEQPANAMSPGNDASMSASEPKARNVRIVYPLSR